MPLINNIDGPTRRIYLNASTVGSTINPIDIYKEMRALRSADESLRSYPVFLSAFGNVSKGNSKFTERFVRENSGCRIVPYNTSQELTINGTIITDDGQEGISCFDRTPLAGTTIVDINYIPPQVEVISVGTSGLTQEESDAVLNSIPSINSLASDTAFFHKTLKNKKEILKISGNWYLIIYEDDSVAELIRKKLLDNFGDPISDLEAGTLSAELKSSV